MPSSGGIESFALINEVDAQSSPIERTHSVLKQTVLSEVRKLAISLMFPLLEKYNMPIKLV